MYFACRQLTVRYDKVTALRDVSLELAPGEIVALIGANGAGKSTTLRAITGLRRPAKGEIWFEGARIDQLPPAEIVKRGIAMVPEGRRIYPYMTVKDNLLMGAYLRKDSAGIRQDLEKIFVRFPRVKERLGQQAGTLSGGEQEMVAVGRALMARPKLLLLDEPSLGLAPTMVDNLFEALAQIRERGVTILLVEQRAQRTVALADRTHVLANGELRMTLGPGDADDTDKLVAAYLAS
jgi:branched-chain amino acid transport system ATP-binding protein